MTDYSVLKEAESNENQEITIFGNTVNIQEEEEKRLRKAKNAESALEEIQTEKFYNTLRSYYGYREGQEDKFNNMSHADLLEYFYEDRSWRNNNSVSMGMDMANSMTDSVDRLQQFSYIQQTYEQLPSFWNDPNRSFGDWLIDNGGAMILDPVNLIGVGVGGQAAKQAYKAALKEALKGKIAKEVSKRVIQQAQKEAQQAAMGNAIKKGALYEGFIGAGIATGQDAMLQNTAINTGVQDELSLKQLAFSTAAGFGFGTVFGGAFSYGGFKLTNRQLKNTSIKNLEDLHNYGRSTITGKRLFADLSTKKDKKSYYKNLTDAEIDDIEFRSKLDGKDIDEQIKKLRNTRIDGSSKPPKEQLNYTKYNPKSLAKYLKNTADRLLADGTIDKKVVTVKEVEEQARILGLNPDEVIKLGKSRAKKDKQLYAEILAHGDLMAKQTDDMIKLSNQLHKQNITPTEERKILKELEVRRKMIDDILVNQKEMTQNIARAQRFQQINKDAQRAAELVLNPEDPKLKNLKETNPKEFYKTLAKLDNDEQVILALQHARKVGKWDLVNEFINNNLLSSPDTHIINIVSGLVQTQWKPLVMLVRAANLSITDRQRAGTLAIEAMDTYIMQYVYIAHAFKQFAKSFYLGRGIIDSKQMKFDNAMRQGQLQQFINASGELLTEPLGFVGKGLQKMVVNPVAYATSVPMRFLTAGDEFLKTIMYKARRTAQIHAQIRNETGSLPLFSKLDKDGYRKRFKEIASEYEKGIGEAIPTADINARAGLLESSRLEVNDPLQYAREGTYTQSAYSINPATGKTEQGVTGATLSFTAKHKWARALGLHFINTPANLLKWNFEQLPLIRKSIVSVRHALMKGKDGKYLNPEAAAEANARMQMGMALWVSAFFAVKAGKFTSGGSRDYKENLEREKTTGWQPYSYKTNDGRYISVNRLDPIMMPFLIMADMFEVINKHLETNEDLPSEAENTMLELSMGVVASLTRNIQSKFYLKNIIETANFLFSDDFARSRAPDRVGTSIFARTLYKFFPLSGGLRYLSRVEMDEHKELLTLSDRLKVLMPQIVDKNSIMPRRNMFGEVINRKNGWLFGLGKRSGLWSSPFAMTEFKYPEISKFFEGRDFDYRPPDKIDRKSGIDLRDIKNKKTGQTAYDRMRELVGVVKIRYEDGKEYTLKEIVEKLVMDKKSQLYRLPDNKVLGEDMRQNLILNYVNAAENVAKSMILKEFPQIIEERIKRGNFKQNEVEKANSALNILLTQ